MKNVLITGATGFIGGHLVDANLKKGNRVRAYALPGDSAIPDLESRGVEVITGDICDFQSLNKAFAGIDIVFHCAAVVTDWAPRSLFQKVTVGGTENCLRAALENGVSRFVDISTNDVFGIDETAVMDESFPLRPWGEPYPDYKIKAEELTWKYHREHNLPVTMVYPCWVYGKNDFTFVPDLADAIIKKDLIFWRKNVLVWPTYIENLVDLLMLISEDERAIGNGYLVHDGESTTLQEFCANISKSLGVPEIKTHIPYFAGYAAALIMEMVWKILRIKTRPLLTTYLVKNLGSRFRYSIEKAEKQLGWKPKISYHDGFARTMEWLKTLDQDQLKTK